MKILIIEDEESAVEQLKNMLPQLVERPQIVGVIDSIEEAVDYLSSRPSIDLIFLDIHLSDGLSFEIFKEVKVDIPVIFTTAYNQYAIQAFEVNSIDYLLKPVKKEKLEKALEKFRRVETRRQFTPDDGVFEKIAQMMRTGNYRRNFLVSFKDRLIPVAADEIAWFEVKEGVVVATKFDNKRLVMDERSLDELAQQLDPALFYRANRQFLVSRKAIREIEYYFNGRLVVKLHPSPEEKVIISRARAGNFKEWMNRE
jgi:two-component system LytT family response regulator